MVSSPLRLRFAIFCWRLTVILSDSVFFGLRLWGTEVVILTCSVTSSVLGKLVYCCVISLLGLGTGDMVRLCRMN